MHPSPRVTEALARLKEVFLEAPSIELSLADAVRVAGLERSTCRIILEALEDVRFLTRTHNGLFIRRPAMPEGSDPKPGRTGSSS
jgi:DNA-binding IclR family transcriptional regulator